MKKQTFLTKHLRLHLLKISALILFSTMLITPLSAQEIPYTPFPKGNIAWQIWGLDGWFYPLPYVLNIDTTLVTIDNVVYNKVFFDKSEFQEQINVGGIREENKKVYLCVPELGEHLIYDFGLAIGDTLFNTLNADINFDHYGEFIHVFFQKSSEETIRVYYVVKDKGFKMLGNGEIRNTLIVNEYLSYDPEEGYVFMGSWEWVEGLGTLNGRGGFLATINVAFFYNTDFDLGCICQNSTLLYSNANYMCSLCGGSQINENLQQQITLYPNPTSGELRITNYELRITSIEIYDIYGKKQCVENNNEKTEEYQLFDISHLQPGFYFVKITTEAGIIVEKIIKK